METTNMSKTRILVEGALMVALATVLSIFKFYEMPQGGSLTVMSMVPIVIMSYRHGLKWGTFTAFVYSAIQLLLGLANVSYCKTLGAILICIFFDYVIAFTVLGLAVLFAGAFAKLVHNKVVCAAFGMALVGLLRFVCHYISGVTIWGQWAPEGTPVWIYSLGYNGPFMLAETVIAIVGVVILCSVKQLHVTDSL